MGYYIFKLSILYYNVRSLSQHQIDFHDRLIYVIGFVCFVKYFFYCALYERRWVSLYERLCTSDRCSFDMETRFLLREIMHMLKMINSLWSIELVVTLNFISKWYWCNRSVNNYTVGSRKYKLISSNILFLLPL